VRINSIKVIAVGGLVLTVAGCSSTFRDREFDYSRENVTLRPALVVPKSVSTNPNISETLVVPSGQKDYQPEKYDLVTASMTPPKYNVAYNEKSLQKSGKAKVKVSLAFNENNSGLMTVFEPLAVTWDLTHKALPDIQGFIVTETDDKNHILTIQQNASHQDYLVYLLPKKNMTQVTIFDENNKVATDSVAADFLEQLQSQLSDQSSMLAMASAKDTLGSGFKDSNIEFDMATKKGVLIIDQTKDMAWDRIIKALEKVGFTVNNVNEAQGFIFIKDTVSESAYDYTVYVYNYTAGGGMFSDWSNWKNLFTSDEIKQTRVNVFDKNGQLLSEAKTKQLLSDIQNNL
jgi:uncharacterized lipoprotein